MRGARATLARLLGAATEPDAVRPAGIPATPRMAVAPVGRTSTTGLPSSRNGAWPSGNTRRLPCRSSSVTASFSQNTTAPQNRPTASSTTRPGSAATCLGWARAGRAPAASTSGPYSLPRTGLAIPANLPHPAAPPRLPCRSGHGQAADRGQPGTRGLPVAEPGVDHELRRSDVRNGPAVTECGHDLVLAHPAGAHGPLLEIAEAHQVTG